MKCYQCGDKTEVNPPRIDEWISDYVKREIFRFLRYHSPTKTLCGRDGCEENDEVNIVPSKKDRFGIVSLVKCIKCTKEMPLEMNTTNAHKLTVIETAKDLNSGDEIMWRRWCGISHHAIYLEKAEPKENNECCSRCRKCLRISDDFLDVISHTFDEQKGGPNSKTIRRMA